jgi:hypothetical protein
MKKTTFILLFEFSVLIGFSQTASRLINTQVAPQGRAKNIMYVGTTLGLNRILNAHLDSIILKQSTILELSDSLLARYTKTQSDSRYLQIGSNVVTSVGLSSADLSIFDSPVTSSGTITANLNTTGVTAGSYNNITVDNKGRAITGTSLVIGAPVAGNGITSGTAFQPRSSGSCQIVINSSLSGVLGVTGSVTIAMSATQNGTYTRWDL